MLRKAALFILGLTLAVAGQSSVLAQETNVQVGDDQLVALYGQGVHAYFDEEYEKAFKMLDLAIQAGSVDPRVYYFRGLTKLKMEQLEEGQADFLAGARIELAGPKQYYPVNRSLQRIQGRERQMIEQARVDARKEAEARAIAIQQARFEAYRIAEALVLRFVDRPTPQLPDLDTTGDDTLPFPNLGGPAGDDDTADAGSGNF